MSKVFSAHAVSVDGFITGRDPGPGRGLGDGGILFDWYGDGDTSSKVFDNFTLSGPSARVFDALAWRVGAVVAGRNTYEDSDKWGGGGPHPTAVRAQPSAGSGGDQLADVRLDRDRGRIARASEPAGDKDVCLMGGGILTEAVASSIGVYLGRPESRWHEELALPATTYDNPIPAFKKAAETLTTQALSGRPMTTWQRVKRSSGAARLRQPSEKTTHNVPVMLTSFVGRYEELEELLALLTVRRQVSLVGVGGCGKTRLALRAAEHLAETATDGPWVVDLSAISDPSRVVRSVAATLNILLEPGGDPAAGLAKQLSNRQLVLLLDTCEHLLEPVAALTDRLLRSCPGLRVLATGREPLGLEGETTWQVPVLEVAEARQLFAERAQLVAPRFELTEAEADVDAVCAKVDRLPLGIELAAAWARALGPAQIAAGLDDSIQLLVGGPRGAIPRHQTLSASIRWSHDMLDQREKVLFRRLAAFGGTFGLEAVSEVAADPDDSVGDPEGETGLPVNWLQLLGRLLDKSLITVRDVGGEVRYRLLDTIRQYAEQELRASGEEDAVLGRHLAYYVRVAEESEPGLDIDQDTWRVVLDGPTTTWSKRRDGASPVGGPRPIPVPSRIVR